MARKKRANIEVEPQDPTLYKDPACPRCDAINFHVFGFNFCGQWRLENLLFLAASSPELIARCEDEINPN